MKVRKILVSSIGLALFSAAIVSCSSSDDFTSQLEIADNVATKGIESEIDGLYTTIKIKSNDSWTIEVPEEAQKWLNIPVTSGQGDMEVSLSIDANLRSTVGRSTVVTVKTGGVEQKISVKQTPTYQGQPVAANGESMDMYAMSIMKGVGMGYDIESNQPTTPIVNLNAVKALADSDKISYGTLFNYNTESAAKADGDVKDSLESKRDTLGAAVSFSLNYANFKLVIGGKYQGSESKNYDKNEYNYGASFKIATSNAAVGSIKSLFNTAYAKNDGGVKACLMQESFKEHKKDIEDAIAAKDSDLLNDAIESLVSEYGAFVIDGATLGGRIAMSMKFNRDSLADVLKVDTAHIQASYKSFLSADKGGMEINGGGEVSYAKIGTTLLKNSAFKFAIEGGTSETNSDVVNSLTLTRKQGDEETVYSNVQDKIKKWQASINANDASTITATKYHLYPIWCLFSSKASTAIKNWIYKNTSSDKLGLLKLKEVQAE